MTMKVLKPKALVKDERQMAVSRVLSLSALTSFLRKLLSAIFGKNATKTTEQAASYGNSLTALTAPIIGDIEPAPLSIEKEIYHPQCAAQIEHHTEHLDHKIFELPVKPAPQQEVVQEASVSFKGNAAAPSKRACLKAAARHDSVTEWLKNDRPTYKAALSTHGIWKECLTQMRRGAALRKQNNLLKNRPMNRATCLKAAGNYSSISSWIKNDRQTYHHAFGKSYWKDCLAKLNQNAPRLSTRGCKK